MKYLKNLLALLLALALLTGCASIRFNNGKPSSSDEPKMVVNQETGTITYGTNR